MREKVVRVYLDEELYNEFKEYCDRLRVDMSTFLRMKIAEELMKHRHNKELVEYMKVKFDRFIEQGLAEMTN